MAGMMRVPAAPGASVPRLHGKDVQAPVIDTGVSPGGDGSVTITWNAVEGPAFVTVLLYAMLWPGTTTSGPILLIPTFALGVSLWVSVAEFGVGSLVPAGTCVVTVLTSMPRASGATVPVSLKVATAFTGRSTVVAIEPMPLSAAHLPPPVALHVHITPLSTAGTGSFTMTPNTSLGPEFFTVMV